MCVLDPGVGVHVGGYPQPLPDAGDQAAILTGPGTGAIQPVGHPRWESAFIF